MKNAHVNGNGALTYPLEDFNTIIHIHIYILYLNKGDDYWTWLFNLISTWGIVFSPTISYTVSVNISYTSGEPHNVLSDGEGHQIRYDFHGRTSDKLCLYHQLDEGMYGIHNILPRFSVTFDLLKLNI